MATRFFDGVQAQAYAACLAVTGGAISITGPDGALLARWALRGLRVVIDPDGAATVRHGRDPARLVVDDPAGLAALRSALPAARFKPGWMAALAGCLAVLALLAAFVLAAPDMLAPLVPAAWDRALGRAAESAAMVGHRRCVDAAGQAALDGLLARLGPVPARIVVSDDGTVNAFALPGNRILLPRGMIQGVADGDELAGVLAHEMGHLVHRDALRGVLRSTGLHLAAAALGWGGFDTAGLAGDLASLSFSRAAEARADAFAVSALRQAGLRADGLGRFLAENEHGAALPGFLSDHPASAERQRVTKAGPDGNPAFSQAEWRAIRAMCHAADAQPI